MDISKIDFTKKENQTFRNWLAVIIQNGYLARFFAGIVLGIIFLLANFNKWYHYFLLVIPAAILFFIIYKGFYQHWNDLKKGNSR